MKTKTRIRVPKSALPILAVLAVAAAVLFAQTPAGIAPTSQGPNLKPKPAPAPLPVPQFPSQVDPGSVKAFDAAVAAMKPVPNDIDLTVEVVGLDIRPGSREEKQLNEVAAAGAGKYYGVQDAAKLAQVFAKVASGRPAATGGGGGGMVLPKAGLPGPAVAAGALAFLSLLLLTATIILRKRRASGPAGPKIRARLDIVLPDGRHSAFEIRAAVTAIGRAGDNAVVLDDERISGHHAQILAGAGGFRLRDLGSTNGTLVRGERITETAIYAGEEFILGSTRITLGS